MQSTSGSNGDQAKNIRVLAHHDLGGFGNGGEGLGIQQTHDGRRMLYIAHESAPKNFTVMDVTDPTDPHMVFQNDLPHTEMRSNSLDIVGDLLAVAYQTKQPGASPAGVELFDVSDPARPRSMAFFDRSGPYSRGTHCLWFVDGEYIHISSGAPDFVPNNQKDDQFYTIVDVRNPSQPTEVGRWWLPGTMKGDDAPPPVRHQRFDTGFRTHNTNVYPERPDRAYLGYIDGGIVILDISDMSQPRMISRLDYHPPLPGFTHTVLPLFSRDLLIVTDEAIRFSGEDWPKLAWVVDASEESNPVIVGSLPLPPIESYIASGGRFGAHNIHENHPLPTAFRSDRLIFGAFFGGGMRVYDVSNPFHPDEVAYFVPAAPPNAPRGIQINDVYVDENRVIYAIDRIVGGLYILELTI